MLVKITNQCGMNCSHCMEDAKPGSGLHMDSDTFEKALSLTERVELTCSAPTFIFLAGGECTEHPQIVEFVGKIVARGWKPALLSNGAWLSNPELRASLLRPEWEVMVQVTNDSRFYAGIERFEHSFVTYVDQIGHLIKLGRAARFGFDSKGLDYRVGPSCFNLRSLVRYYGNFELAVAHLRSRVATGKAGSCIPAINYDGSVTVGESRFCYQIGTVDSSNAELAESVLSMRTCNKCGLEARLDTKHRSAIGC